MPKLSLDKCAACGADAIMMHAGNTRTSVEYWVECIKHPDRHKSVTYGSGREAAIRWNARQKTLRAYRPPEGKR